MKITQGSWMKTIRGVVKVIGLSVLLVGANTSLGMANFKVDTSISVSETYTDNLFFTKSDKEDDFGTFISPMISLGYEDENIILNGIYRGTAQFFVNNTGGNTYTQNTNFGVGLPFLTRKIDKNLEVRLVQSLNFTPQLPAFSLGGDEEALSNINLGAATTKAGGVGGSGGGIGGGGQGVVAGAGIGGVGGTTGTSGGFSGALNNSGAFTTRKTNAFQNLSGILINYAMSPLVELRLDYRNRYQKFTGSGFQDSMTHTAQSGFSFNVTPNTQVKPSYRLAITDFKGASNVTTHRANLAINHQFTANWRLNLANGVAFTEGDTNFNTNILLSKLYSKGIMSLRFTQDISDGSGIAATATLTQNAVAQLSRNFGRRFNGFVLFGYGNNRSLSGSAINLTTYQGRAGLSMSILSWLSGFATYSYINQNSDGTSANAVTAQSNQVFLGVTGVADPWLPFK
jgi:hypothetical protein